MYKIPPPANKFITEHIFNEDGSSTESIDALGNKTFSSYDKHGNLAEQTDALGNKIAFGYEKNFGALANITASVNGETSSNENVYKCGLLVKTKHNGCEYEFDYDRLGRKTAVRINGDTYCTISYEGKDIQTITYASGERVKKEVLNDGRMCDVFYAKKDETLKEPTIYEYDRSTVNTEKDKYSYKEYIEDRTNVDLSNLPPNTPTNEIPHVKYKTYYDKKGRVAKTEISDEGDFYGERLKIKNEYGFNDSLKTQNVEIGGTTVDKETRTYEYGLKNKLLSIKHENAFTESPTLDKLGRVSSIKKGDLTKQFNYYQNGERATTLVASETFGEQGQKADKLAYTYDKKGNISEIRQNGELIAKYEYDSLNRLVREDNRPLNKSYFMTYDTAGNIVEKKESAFTLGLADTVTKHTVGSYAYGDSLYEKPVDADYISIKGKLLSFNDENIEYDALGNPTVYRDNDLSWSHVNRLASFGSVNFQYNYAGIRLFKIVGAKKTKYYCDGAKVIAQDDGTDLLYFYYGTEGVTGFKYNNTVYHYKKDMLGNILGIYGAYGQFLVKYVYDAWGNHKTFALENNLWVDISDRTAYTTSDNTATKIAILNPFRYRSYYFDIETGLYYLQTRYYDPETGRFISMDSIEYLDPESIHGLNLYAYCANNPVNFVDVNGTQSSPIQTILTFLERILTGLGDFCGFLTKDKPKPVTHLPKWAKAKGYSVRSYNKAEKAAYYATKQQQQKFSKIANTLSYIALGIDMAFAWVNNYNSGSKTWFTDSLVDTVYIGARFAIGSAISSGITAFFTFVVPIPFLGTLVGIAASIGVDYLITYLMENGVLDSIKNWAAGIGDTISNAWNNFWSFSWI